MGLLAFLRSGKLKAALQRGAAVVDVRTPHEYDSGHVPGAINIPLDRLSLSVERIKGMDKPVILCCESGARSEQALRLLKKKGMQDVCNGGSWRDVLRLQKKL